MKPSQISLVYATWCPHCQPQSVEATKKMSEDLKVSLRLLDIDRPDAVKIADDLVKRYGDDSDDYLIPQVFLEFPDGRTEHIFTGFSEDTALTRKHWDDFFKSNFYKSMKD